jgi:hypothetical protein
MSRTVSDFLFERHQEWGGPSDFRLSWRGHQRNNGSLRKARRENRSRPGPARRNGRVHGLRAREVYRGEVGVCLARSGPGAIHLLNGLYDAKLDHVPVVAIVGQSATTAIGGNYQQEVDLNVLMKDVASEHCYTASKKPVKCTPHSTSMNALHVNGGNPRTRPSGPRSSRARRRAVRFETTLRISSNGAPSNRRGAVTSVRIRCCTMCGAKRASPAESSGDSTAAKSESMPAANQSVRSSGQRRACKTRKRCAATA